MSKSNRIINSDTISDNRKKFIITGLKQSFEFPYEVCSATDTQFPYEICVAESNEPLKQDYFSRPSINKNNMFFFPVSTFNNYSNITLGFRFQSINSNSESAIYPAKILNDIPKQVTEVTNSAYKNIFYDQYLHFKEVTYGISQKIVNATFVANNYVRNKLINETSNAFATTISHIFTGAASEEASEIISNYIKPSFGPGLIEKSFSSFAGSLGFFFSKTLVNSGLVTIMDYAGCNNNSKENGFIKSLLCNKVPYFLAIDGFIIYKHLVTYALLKDAIVQTGLVPQLLPVIEKYSGIGSDPYIGPRVGPSLRTKFLLITAGKFVGYFLSNAFVDALEANNLLGKSLPKQEVQPALRDGITSTRLLSKQFLDLGSHLFTGSKSTFKNFYPFIHKVSATILFDVGFEFIVRSNNIDNAKSTVYGFMVLNIFGSIASPERSLSKITEDGINFISNSVAFDLNDKFINVTEIKYLSSKEEFSHFIEIFNNSISHGIFPQVYGNCNDELIV